MICGREASTIGAGKGRSQIEDLRSLLGDAKRRTGREVVDVGSVEKRGGGSLRRDRIVGNGEKERTTFLGTKFRAVVDKIGERRHIP